jgi:hypothetical protein
MLKHVPTEDGVVPGLGQRSDSILATIGSSMFSFAARTSRETPSSTG